jgi:hypothetical protein
MRVSVFPFVVLAGVLANAPVAFAQEKGQVGLSLGFPASVGLVWHITDSIGIRPEFGFSFGSGESTTEPITTLPGGSVASVSTSDTRSIGFGVSALFYVHERDNLRLFVSPRIAYSDLHVENEQSISVLPPPIGGSTLRVETDGTAITVSGSFGAQYSLSRRFSVFGEFGMSYADSETEGSTSLAITRSSSTSQSWSSRGGAGVVFYF